MARPLAERLRPNDFDGFVGQEHLVGEGAVLRRMIDGGRILSFILWGPPGTGKTTIAKIIANRLKRPFYTLNAVSSGVKEVREVIEKSKSWFVTAGVFCIDTSKPAAIATIMPMAIMIAGIFNPLLFITSISFNNRSRGYRSCQEVQQVPLCILQS